MAIKRRSVLAGGAGLLAGGWASAPAILRAQSGGATITSHGFATHGDVSYPADAKNLEYVNPAAPKGGTIRLAGRGTFDSLNPFIPGVSSIWLGNNAKNYEAQIIGMTLGFSFK